MPADGNPPADRAQRPRRQADGASRKIEVNFGFQRDGRHPSSLLLRISSIKEEPLAVVPSSFTTITREGPEHRSGSPVTLTPTLSTAASALPSNVAEPSSTSLSMRALSRSHQSSATQSDVTEKNSEHPTRLTPLRPDVRPTLSIWLGMLAWRVGLWWGQSDYGSPGLSHCALFTPSESGTTAHQSPINLSASMSEKPSPVTSESASAPPG